MAKLILKGILTLGLVLALRSLNASAVRADCATDCIFTNSSAYCKYNAGNASYFCSVYCTVDGDSCDFGDGCTIID